MLFQLDSRPRSPARAAGLATKTATVVLCGFLILAAAFEPLAQDSSAALYEQKTDVVYGEAYGMGLLMDVFTPKGKANGLGIIDVVSGAYNSDRGKIRD